MNIKKLKTFLLNKSLENNIFYLSIFLLPSAPFFSSLILLFLGIKLSFKNKTYFSDKWNIPFFYAGLLIIISCLSNFINGPFFYNQPYQSSLIWIGIFNWIPYFWVFWVFQQFTETSKDRYKIGLFLLAGSVPVILTCLAQYFLKIHGPFTFLQGIITWYLRPIHSYNGMSGLFNNANYTGTWLNIILPFSLVLFFEEKQYLFKRIVSIFFLFFILICTIFTFSRNAILGLIIGSILVMGYKSLKWILPTLFGISIPIITSIGVIPNENLINISKKIVPEIIWNYRFNSIGIENLDNYGRINIWNSAINFILEKPIWGWGSSSFPTLYEATNNIYKAHTHNLALELAISFGIPVMLIIITSFILIFYFSKNKVFYKDKSDPYEVAWWTTSLLILISQMYDIQYYDIRIGLIFWLFLGGLRNIIRNK